MGLQHGNKKLYGTATIGSKGQVVIPADAREELGLQPGDRLYVISAMHKGVVFLKEEALEETRKMLDVYADFAENFMAVPVIKGEKTAGERFPGADMTLSIEAFETF